MYENGNMTKNLTIGIIGCGMVAHNHINSFRKIKEASLKWVCDASESVVHAVGEQYSLSFCTTDYQTILNDPTVDAVVICTPPNSHFQIAIDAIHANKHVLLEKPATITLKELKLLNNVIENHPNLIILDCSARHSRLQPKFNFFKELISSGKLGHVYGIHHNVVNRASRPGIEYHPTAKWFLNKSISGGGPLIDWGVYDLSFHLGILGDTPTPASIKAFTVSGLDRDTTNDGSFDIEEHAIVVMQFDPNLIYYWERASNAHNEAQNETRIYGTKGGLKFSYLSWESGEAEYYFLDINGIHQKELITVDLQGHSKAEDDFYAMDLHFIECILDHVSPILPFSLSAKHLNIIFNCIENASFFYGVKF